MATGGDYLDKKVDSSALAETQGRSSGDFAATGEFLNIDEKKLVRKLDLHLIPIVMLTYLLSFLDRCAPPLLSLSHVLANTHLQRQHRQLAPI
jgi:hypothetical protein